MQSYLVVGFNKATNIITLLINGEYINFPVPVNNGLYPEGDELTNLLQTYATNAAARQSAQSASTLVANNTAAIINLITEPPVVPVTITTSDQARNIRTRLLGATDWTQLPGAPLTSDQVTAWAAYRTELRNLTTQPGFFTNITWPIPPVAVMNMIGLSLTDSNGVPVQRPLL
jgi:hypothetical protein